MQTLLPLLLTYVAWTRTFHVRGPRTFCVLGHELTAQVRR